MSCFVNTKCTKYGCLQMCFLVALTLKMYYILAAFCCFVHYLEWVNLILKYCIGFLGMIFQMFYVALPFLMQFCRLKYMYFKQTYYKLYVCQYSAILLNMLSSFFLIM